MAKNRKVTGSKKFIATLPYLMAPNDEQTDRMEIDFHQGILYKDLESEELSSILNWIYEIYIWQYDQMYICVNSYESWLYTIYEFPLGQNDEDLEWLASHPVYEKYFFFDLDRYRIYNFPYMNWFDTEALPDDDLSDIFSQMAEDAHTDPELYQ